jgi:hypothetical protein
MLNNTLFNHLTNQQEPQVVQNGFVLKPTLHEPKRHVIGVSNGLHDLHLDGNQVIKALVIFQLLQAWAIHNMPRVPQLFFCNFKFCLITT